ARPSGMTSEIISASSRLFIREIIPETNTITLSPTKEEKTEHYLEQAVYSGMQPPPEGTVTEDLYAKVRYSAKPVLAEIRWTENRIRVKLASPAGAVTPGQSCVLYAGDRIMFGGVIQLK
ncbi:MAG: hypothetical protein MJ078_03785, partial [Clostridia bacterium]|nr:hypothetical protein [Clostridia bacterium]